MQALPGPQLAKLTNLRQLNLAGNDLGHNRLATKKKPNSNQKPESTSTTTTALNSPLLLPTELGMLGKLELLGLKDAG